MAEQEYIVFDFDGTIYKGDCSVDLYRYMIKKKKAVLIHLPMQLACFVLWKLHLVSTDRFKQAYFRFLNGITPQQLDTFILDFWQQKTDTDFNPAIYNRLKLKAEEGYTCIVITASPQLIVEPLVKKLFAADTIGTLLEYRNRSYFLVSPNCKGIQKVIRFEEKFGQAAIIKEAYSDNASDVPLFKRALKAFKIKGSLIKEL